MMAFRQVKELTCNKRAVNHSRKRYLTNIGKRGRLSYEKQTPERNNTDYFQMIGTKLQGYT